MITYKENLVQFYPRIITMGAEALSVQRDQDCER